MPVTGRALCALNSIFGDPDALRDLDAALYGPGADVRDATRRLVSGTPAYEGLEALLPSVDDVLDRVPRGITEALRALIFDNLSRDEPVPMTFAWAPGYDFEVTMWEAPPTVKSPGDITVLFKSRYPADPHPVTGEQVDPDAR